MSGNSNERWQISLHPIVGAIDGVKAHVLALEGVDPDRQAALLNFLNELRQRVIDECEIEEPSFMSVLYAGDPDQSS